MKKLLTILLTMILIISFSIPNCFATKKTDFVKVTIPKFKIMFNGVEINNKNNKYPFIVFKDITYVPLTWNYCDSLGLTSNWSEKNGLTINRDDSKSNSNVVQDLSCVNDMNKTYYATIANYKITLNNKELDNSQRMYPILNFKNVTYFPLAYNFVVNDFKGRQTFDKSNGLLIQSATYSPVFKEIVKEFYLEDKLKKDKLKYIQNSNLSKTTIKGIVVSTSRGTISVKDVNTNQIYLLDTFCLYNGDIGGDIYSDVSSYGIIEMDCYVDNNFGVYPINIKVYSS